MLAKVYIANKHIIIGCLSILILLFCITFFSGNFLQLLGIEKISTTAMYLSRLFFWFSLILLFIYTTKVEQNFLLWEEKKYSLPFSIVALILLLLTVYGGVIVIQTIFKIIGLDNKSITLSKIVLLLKKDFILLVFTALTAGIVEELIFRGYLQPRLQLLLKSPHLSIFVSCLLFGLLHYKYGTVINVVGPFFIGLILAYFYWKYRSIKLAIIFHFLWDFILLIISTNTLKP